MKIDNCFSKIISTLLILSFPVAAISSETTKKKEFDQCMEMDTYMYKSSNDVCETLDTKERKMKCLENAFMASGHGMSECLRKFKQ